MTQILSIHFAKSSSCSSILFQGFRTWNSLLFDIENALAVFKYIEACDQTIFKGQTECNLNTLTPYIYIFL